MDKLHLTRAILDEIALEGLEGITLSSLWVYLCASHDFSSPPNEHLQEQVWDFIKSVKPFSFYELPTERPTVVLFNRFEHRDADLGIPLALKARHLPFKYSPIKDGNITGSCESYKKRKRIPIERLRNMTCNEVIKTWGNRFVIVASQEQRFAVLTPFNLQPPKDLSVNQYVCLEIIGRSRYNGETTSGHCSLLDFNKDSSIIFYVKNRLVQSGLVAAQSYNEKREDRYILTTLVTLPRFFRKQKSILAQAIEKINRLLKEAPNQCMALQEIYRNINISDNRKIFKKITSTHAFRQFFEIRKMLASDLGVPKKLGKNKEELKERPLSYVYLRDSNISIDDALNDKEDITENFHDESHSFVDMPLKDEFIRAVVRYGARGCSRAELCDYLAVNATNMRQLLKISEKKGLITSYTTDIGRQRFSRYVAIEFANAVKQNKNTTQEILKNLKCDEEPNLPKNDDVALSDLPHVIGCIRPHTFRETHTRDAITQRQIARKTLIVQAVNEKCLLNFLDLRCIIQRAEKAQGYHDEMCRKSMSRLLQYMCEQNVLRTYEIMLKYEEHVRLHHLVTHPKIDCDHELLKREMFKAKNAFYLMIEERNANNIHKAAMAKKKAIKQTEPSKHVVPLQVHKTPRFLISRFMHELLFYIVVELNEYQQSIEITEELLENWKTTEPSLQINEYWQQLQQSNEKLIVYTSELSWRTFIPPLPKYSDKPTGWIFFMDAIDRMPLSVFNKIFRIEKGADERLLEFLAHPVQQHYLIRQLPFDLQNQISRAQLQKVYVVVLKLLNHLGLIQVSERQNIKDPLCIWAFLNRRTQIRDTTSTEARYSSVNPDREYPVIPFMFNNTDDLELYWTQLQRICVYTKLGSRRGKYKKYGRSDLKYVGSVEFNEAPSRDTGDVPGDHAGAAGLSTNLFAHTFRYWSWVQQLSTPLPKSLSMPYNTGSQFSTQRKRTNAKNRYLPPQVKALPTGLNRARTAAKKPLPKKNCGPRDVIDRDALRNMNTLRVSWSPNETQLLKIGRTVYIYLAAPVPTLGMIAVGKICRDVIRHVLGIRNKTIQACVRRLKFMVKNKRIPELPSLLHMLQTSKDMQRLYGGKFLQNLKQAYPDRLEYCDALHKHFIRIMIYLHKLLRDNENHKFGIRFTIPNSITEFTKNFRECKPLTAANTIYYKNPKDKDDVKIATVLNVLHSSLCCSRDKTLYNLQAFEIYKDYSEEILQKAYQKARADALVIAIKRKNNHIMPTQMAGPAFLLSQKYRARLTFLKIPYLVYDTLYDYLNTAICTFYGPSTSAQSAQRLLELKSPHVGQLFLISECLGSDFWQSNVKLPASILTVEKEKPSDISPADRTLDHNHGILENAPETEYTKHVETKTTNKKALVKFHPASLTYKIHYSPYDVIAKLPIRLLHFFCALDHLHKTIDTDFSKLRLTGEKSNYSAMECPFTCIMLYSNYFNAIKRIVHEKRSVLRELYDLPSQKPLIFSSNEKTVVVQPNNLLALVQKLESLTREYEQPMQRKDLGKLPPRLKKTISIDYQQFCQDILDFTAMEKSKIEANDAYGPTPNKEDRIMRAHDVFVVNLPTLEFRESKKLLDTNCRIPYNKLLVPQLLLDAEVQRETILQATLQKSFWTYTENTFENLRPKFDELHLNSLELQHLEKVHNFIEAHTIGVTIATLKHEFPNEKFLQRSLQLLSEHSLIKRVGVATFMYVHKNHIRPWIVHSFHIKRLGRETLGGGKAAAKMTMEMATLKRKHDESQGVPDEEAASTSKQAKLDVVANTGNCIRALGKRVSKPVKRLADEPTIKRTRSDIAREVIVMRPQPWIRLNGSINRRVLDRWLGAILTECVSQNGCFVHDICLRFPHMMPVDLMILLEILRDLRCIHFKMINMPEVQICSEYEEVKETHVYEIHNPHNTYIYTEIDAVMRMAVFIGNKKYGSEFV